MAGPPARIWIFTPVSTPARATSSPVTSLELALIVGFGPTSSYWPPCSASGFQSVCSTIVDGQPAAFRLSAAGIPAADEVPDADVVADAGLTGVLLLLLLAQAVAASARAVPTVAARATLADLPWDVSNVSLHYG